MDFSSDILRYDERIIFKLRGLYGEYGYSRFKMSRFEEYSLYTENRAFLPDGNIVTFTDSGGKLMALRPDVTLSILKNIKNDTGLKKLYYNENVYRTASGELQEQMQVGLECIGQLDEALVSEVLLLAKKSLETIVNTQKMALGMAQIDISHMGFLGGLLRSENLTTKQSAEIISCISKKNISGLKTVCEESSCNESFCEKLTALTMLYGSFGDVKSELLRISVNEETQIALSELEKLDSALKELGASEGIHIDFSVVNDITYYSGIVFQGFIAGIPGAVLSGGRYDELVHKFGKNESAIGFAVYLDLINRHSYTTASNGIIGIALPKGRLGEKAYEIFRKVGFGCADMDEDSRKLVFENPDMGIRHFWVKPSDVAIYVERGVADIGVVGKDTLLENNSDIYELLDLGIGKCSMCIAAEKNRNFECQSETLRIATKFPNIARGHYRSRGQDIDIIKLHGSIELAPLLGLSDVIVDLVETGKTLEENNMESIETITEISARLVSNKASYKFNHEKINNLCKAIESNVE